MDIDRALRELKTERTLDRINPNNPECPGCGRKDREDFLNYSVTLLTGENKLCCPECADDELAGMSVAEYRQDLLDNWQPLGHMSVSVRYRGILLPPDFYSGMEVV